MKVSRFRVGFAVGYAVATVRRTRAGAAMLRGIGRIRKALSDRS